MVTIKGSWPAWLYKEVNLGDGGVSFPHPEMLKTLVRRGYNYLLRGFVISPAAGSQDTLPPFIRMRLIENRSERNLFDEYIDTDIFAYPGNRVNNNDLPRTNFLRFNHVFMPSDTITLRFDGAINDQPETVRVLILGRTFPAK